ncbi:MAG: NUDIX hydrolase [Hadesarchaea archaeon]|nr:NUDIX hydrolase [Hadesarchaea archaeon]MDH5685892.1 NUDIX hydrolase [Hadesarchaea archaeon]
MERCPMLAVDVIIRTPDGVVLIKRKNEPYKGMWAIPGGFVRYGEKVEDAAAREVKEETSLKVKLGKLVGVYSDPKRDPRGHVVSVCFLAERASGRLKASSDAQDTKIFKHIPWRELAFDHARILKEAGFK